MCRWARVLAYEPPHRVLFNWDINPQWQIETDPGKTSEVEVRFVSEATRRGPFSDRVRDRLVVSPDARHDQDLGLVQRVMAEEGAGKGIQPRAPL
jgi:uncharacterized protein YndB with AHSA1/START domain